MLYLQHHEVLDGVADGVFRDEGDDQSLDAVKVQSIQGIKLQAEVHAERLAAVNKGHVRLEQTRRSEDMYD